MNWSRRQICDFQVLARRRGCRACASVLVVSLRVGRDGGPTLREWSSTCAPYGTAVPYISALHVTSTTAL